MGEASLTGQPDNENLIGHIDLLKVKCIERELIDACFDITASVVGFHFRPNNDSPLECLKVPLIRRLIPKTSSATNTENCRLGHGSASFVPIPVGNVEAEFYPGGMMAVKSARPKCQRPRFRGAVNAAPSELGFARFGACCVLPQSCKPLSGNKCSIG